MKTLIASLVISLLVAVPYAADAPQFLVSDDDSKPSVPELDDPEEELEPTPGFDMPPCPQNIPLYHVHMGREGGGELIMMSKESFDKIAKHMQDLHEYAALLEHILDPNHSLPPELDPDSMPPAPDAPPAPPTPSPKLNKPGPF